jgi:oligosaccharyltransferase complex subunit beta
MRNAAVLGLLLLVVGSLCLTVSSEKKILVLYGQSSIKETHGQFFKGLEAKGHTVDIMSVKDSGLKLKDYDTWLYDALVLFAPKAASECSQLLISCGSAAANCQLQPP